MKKFFFIFLSLSLVGLFIFQIDFSKKQEGGCPFCNPEILKRQTFYEGEKILGILTYKPATQGHVLIIPKRHVERFEDLTAEEIQELAQGIKKIDPIIRKNFGNTDYLLLQKNGKTAGQSVPHVHIHYLPASRFLIAKYFFSNWKKPLTQDEQLEIKKLLSAGAF